MQKLLWGGGSHSVVLINGSEGAYFECRKGVRQGDLISLYVFLLAVEGLHKILSLGISKGHFEGLGPVLSSQHKIMHLQYADDTLLFLRADPHMVERLKWALLIFENISGLKINLSKSELVPLNLDPAQGQYLASLLNCYLRKLPIKYLDVNLHWKKPYKSDWQLLIDKFHKKLPQWKGNHLSLGGRLVLLNSVLSSITLYYISLFKIPAWVLSRIDQIRKRFLWAGVNSSTTRKYYLVRWATVCRAKEFGGWGIINLAQMNCALLCKWG
jgi:Reverse transcriptase (RNA-dependent DNA polymerase)